MRIREIADRQLPSPWSISNSTWRSSRVSLASNGVGMSTVLQFIDFLSQQVRGDIEGWLAERSWKPTDLKSRLFTKKNNIDFKVDIVGVVEMDRPLGSWEANFNTSKLYCTFERLSIGRNGPGRPRRHLRNPRRFGQKRDFPGP